MNAALDNGEVQDFSSIGKDEHIMFFDKNTTAELARSVADLEPSDRFVVDEKDALNLMDLWLGKQSQYVRDIPADLIFSETFPMTDCEIVLDLPDLNKQMTMRVCIYPDYKERITGKETGEVTPIGMFMYYLGIGTIAVPLGVQIGRDSIAVHFMAAGFGVSEYYQQDFSKYNTVKDHLMFIHDALCTWYGIQLTLLHPRVTERVSKGNRTKVRIPKSQRGNKRRVTRYIRVHQIKKADIDEMMAVGGGFTRHTLAWYVIGHWRNLPNGTKTFVKPYWKGPCRAMKRNLDEGRDRQIVLPEGEAI